MLVGSALQIYPFDFKPSAPPSGSFLLYAKTDDTLYIQDSTGTEFAFGSTGFISQLVGEATAMGPGVATVTLTNSAVIGKVLTGFSPGPNSPVAATDTILEAFEKVQAQLNATTSSAITALTGDVSAAGPGSVPATVNFVGGSSAANVHSAELAANAATSVNTPSTIVERDSSGNFSANTITANITGNVSGSSSSFTGSLSGDISGTQTTTSVDKIKGTSVNPTVPTDTQLLIYNSTTTQWIPKSLSGDINNDHLGVVTIQPNVVSNTKLSQMPANTVKANITGSTANATDAALGTVTESTSSVLNLSGWSNATIGSPTIQIIKADSTHSGYLSSTDWNTFNSTSGSAITALTGDGTATGPGSAALTLSTVNSNVGTFGTAGAVGTFTVNAKGLITAASNTTIGGLTNSNLSGSAGITGSNIATNTVANINLSQMPANTVKANTTGVPATPVDTLLGTVTEATSSILTLTGWTDATIGSPTIQVTKADSTHSGYLSSTDWNTFNTTSSNAITALTGDVTATGPGSVASTVTKIQGTSVSTTAPTDAQFLVYNTGATKYNPVSLSTDATLSDTGALTLSTVNSNVGSFGSSTSIPSFTVNAKGLITAASGNAVIAPAGTLTGTTLASNVVNSSLQNLGTQNANLNMGNNEVVNVSQLGIGTSTPGANTSIDIVNTSGSTQVVQQTGYGAATGHRGRYANGSLIAPTAATTGNILEFISGRGYGSTAFAAASTGSINIVAGSTFTDTSMPTYIAFNTTPTGSVTSSQRMQIAPTGNILIGSTVDDNSNLLQVAGNARIGPTTGSSNVSLAFANSNTFTMSANPASSFSWLLPTTQGSSGTYLSNDGSGNLSWTNPLVNIDGGSPSSNYTSGQFVSGGTP